MKTLLIGLAFAHSGATAQPPAHPALYSFADVYRLTVAGPVGGVVPLETAPEAPIRVAGPQAQPSEPRFSITAPTQPDKALLLFAGLALAGWVAHRRLTHAL
jgi:hypothetical protein